MSGIADMLSGWPVLLLSALVLLLDLWAIGAILRHPGRYPHRMLWFAIIVLLPLVGVLLWWLLRPRTQET